MDVKLVYIGDGFYDQSKTVMSPLYEENGRRYDWGFVQRDLREGRSISIRQANAIERQFYDQRLSEIISTQR